jgi:hypothetical protein
VSIEFGAPDDMFSAHPETAYFWGRVTGDGDCTENSVTVHASDETAARRLAAIAGAERERIDHRITEREYAHDASITRIDDEYTVQVFGELADRANALFGPDDYRFDLFDKYTRQLLRGLLEGCGTICFKRSSGTVGLSFVHSDRRLLERIQSLVAGIPVDAPTTDISETSSGGYWFGIEDRAVPAVGPWLYEDCEITGLFAPSRKRKLIRSIERVE